MAETPSNDYRAGWEAGLKVLALKLDLLLRVTPLGVEGRGMLDEAKKLAEKTATEAPMFTKGTP